jgi:hypothetical protein
VTFRLLVVSPSAVSGGYGVQSQFVPRGTESPSATTDDDAEDEVPQPVAAQPSATRAANAHTDRRAPIPRV